MAYGYAYDLHWYISKPSVTWMIFCWLIFVGISCWVTSAYQNGWWILYLIQVTSLHKLSHLTYLFHAAQSFLRSQPASDSQEIPCILWNPNVCYHVYKCPPTCPYPKPDQSSPSPPHHTSWRSILIWSSHTYLCLPSGLFPSRFPTKMLYVPIPSPYMKHALPISLSTWSPK